MIEAGIPPEWKEQWDDLIKHLHDPLKMRVATLGIVAAIGFLGIYRPIDGQIQLLRREVKASQQRLATIRQVESLRKAQGKLLENFPPAGTLNYWQKYFLAGIRDANVKLRSLESVPKKLRVGALQVIYLEIESSGQYDEIHKLLSWIETNRWFTRVIRLTMKGRNGEIQSRITVAVLVPQASKAHGV